VFKEIEFYIPQLAHLIVHLDQDSKTQSLERLAMVLCQNSVHAALQLTFLFSAALEDYQPENINGQTNAQCNPFFFKRCARLLQDIERAVIYGSQTLSAKEERVLKQRKMSNASFDPKMDPTQFQSELIDDKKLEIANRLSKSSSGDNYDGIGLNGTLLYKRTDRKSSFASKQWKARHFMVDQRVLFCFREPHSVCPLRTLSLASCHVEVIEHDPKYGETRFDIVNFSNNSKFQMRAENKAQREKWVAFLRRYAYAFL
jgi:phosphatidylinositol 4-kinase B